MDDYDMVTQQWYDADIKPYLMPALLPQRCYHCHLVLEGEGVPIRLLIDGRKLIAGQFCAACALDPFRVIAR